MVPFAPLELGPAVGEHLDQLKDNPLVKGVRRLIQTEELGFCTQDKFVQGVQLLSDYGFSFDICIYHTQLADTLELVKQCPNVKFVLDHVGKPDIKAKLLEPWQSHMKQLAAFENVWCKLSGMITEADHKTWKSVDLQPYMTHATDCFGFDRLMFGGDWPVITLAGDWKDWHAIVAEHFDACSEPEQQKLFHANAVNFYRL